MGDSLSAIRDDEDDYEYLCKKYGETEQVVYSIHYRWLNAKHNKETNLSYEEYALKEKIKEAQRQISNLERDIERKQEDLKQLKDELQNYQG